MLTVYFNKFYGGIKPKSCLRPVFFCPPLSLYCIAWSYVCRVTLYRPGNAVMNKETAKI